jgi:hypothetical protein
MALLAQTVNFESNLMAELEMNGGPLAHAGSQSGSHGNDVSGMKTHEPAHITDQVRDTAGSPEGSIRRSRSSNPGLNASRATSEIMPDRFRIFLSASRKGRLFRPGAPYLRSFISDSLG